MSEVEWDYTNGLPETYFEVGLTAAFKSLGCNGYCSQPYWAERDSSGTFHVHTFMSPFPFADGVQRYYYTLPAGCNNCFAIYTSPTTSVSWTYQGTTSYQTGSLINLTQVGLEDEEGATHSDYGGSEIDPDESTQQFDAGVEALVNGSWQTLSLNPEIDYPCSIYPTGYCFNGYSYGISEWSDNKP